MQKSLAIEYAFAEYSFYQRFALAKEAGFSYVELDEWTELDFTAILAVQQELSIGISALSGSIGHTLTDAKSREFFLEHLSQSIAVAKSFCAANLFLTYSPEEQKPSPAPETGDYTRLAFATGTLMDAARMAKKAGITLLLRPAGTPGKPAGARTLHTAIEVVRAVNSPTLRLVFDVAQMRRLDGGLLANLRRCRDVIGYIRVAQSLIDSDRNEAASFARMLTDELDYTGFVGFTFVPDH